MVVLVLVLATADQVSRELRRHLRTLEVAAKSAKAVDVSTPRRRPVDAPSTDLGLIKNKGFGQV